MKYQFKTPKTNQWRFLLTSGTVNDYKKPVTSLIIQCGVWFVLELIFPQFIYSHTETVDLQPWGGDFMELVHNGSYYHSHPRWYGFILQPKVWVFFYGIQYLSPSTQRKEKMKWDLPWTQYRQVLCQLFDKEGYVFWSIHEPSTDRSDPHYFRKIFNAKSHCLKSSFLLRDFDDSEVLLYTHVERRIWKLGTGLFKWLSWFSKPKEQLVLVLEFDDFVGLDKHTRKGGMKVLEIPIHHSESQQEVVKRFCDKPHRALMGQYRMKFVMPVDAIDIEVYNRGQMFKQ